MMPNETEFETALSDGAQNEAKPQVLTHYSGRETVERTMTGMMQEMKQSTERTGRRRILGAVDMLRSMGCDNEAIRQHLIQNYGVSAEEAESILPSNQ